ncbi:acyl-CoA synthetase [Dissulfurispira thermophila]|uniref:Acyl-CoA synthetase n=2 Tax=root TaxID=1 RepID=A0A7G1H302_9BACT|nr:acyl--CoA ligase [Dissulfurispira thermophila]BCB96559.1 acyl-CoA synthetase [Dissulfurispira thermophila]
MEQTPNMKDYWKEYRGFSLHVPEKFSFPLDVFDKWAKDKNSLALFWTDGKCEKEFTFNELKTLSSKAAGAFRKIGIKKGDKVIVIVPNIPEWWEVMLALMRLNAIPIPATTLLTSKDIAYRLSAVDITAIIATDEDASKVEDAVRGMSSIPLLIIIGKRPGWIDYLEERNLAYAFEGERAFSDEPALIYFTSGTTGPPKMVLHSHASYPFAHVLTGRYWLDLRPGDIHWNLSDTGWAKAAWSSLFGPWHMGAAVFSFYKKGKFEPLSTIEILNKYPITTFCGPPTAYRMIVKELSESKLTFHSMRHFVAAGEPLNKEIIEIWKDRTGQYIYDGYGQTETVNVLASFRCIPVKPGSMGLPVPGFVVDVIDEDGNPLPPNAEGDIAIKIKPERPIGLFKEYLGNLEATEKTMRGQWYMTGDRAYKDEEGYFWFVGRADDVILTSGYRIGPFEIESVLLKHPAIKESAVVASPDEVRGEVVKAFIVLTKNYSPSDALIKELQEFVKVNTAPYKYPRKIEFVDDLPKTISGKIKRKELKLKEFGKK